MFALRGTKRKEQNCQSSESKPNLFEVCRVVMRLKCQCQAAAKRALRSILSASYPPPCGCRTRSTGFPSVSSSLDPFDTISLSRTHPQPSETTTHPDRPMKRFKKKALNQPHKNLNNTTPSPSFHRPNKKPRKQHAPPNFQAED